MKTITSITLASLLGFTIGSCGWFKSEKENKGSPTEAAKNIVKEWSIMGEWESACKGSDILKTHAKRRYSFKGDVFSVISEFYLGNDKCTGEPSFVQTYEGTFKVLDINEDADKARNVNFEYKNSYLTANGDAGIKALNAVNFCGIADWHKSKKEKVQGDGSSACPFNKVPQTHLDLVKVEDNNKLFFGHTILPSFSQKRPTELDRDEVYKKK